MKVVALVGSIRKESYNVKLAAYVKNKYKEQMDVEILNLRDVPFYDQDIENDPPAAVKELREKVAAADAVLWVTPEYNYSIPGVLKNVIDWLSRGDRVMVGKPSIIMGASMGLMGSVRAQQHLRDILFSPGINSPLLPGNEVYVGIVHEKMDENGKIKDEATVLFLDSVINNFVKWYNQQASAMALK
ncbi:NAD(P)H-dependent oxidoreductase [Paenibacillus dokdonensis]|uniref:NAD(P)H-dependent oxidoreductase n=1 Tax=Paenibacillus dokdonensis TaxID=2567944 RepID=A0ABU6GWB7_9BACL|nr:NADPH-dependent FMN reductase [Paenibacillus dokdonensis]MEC0243688.1 NAD(P)H-dependent oxidoreductase [Paenibacillus dokdonensis]